MTAVQVVELEAALQRIARGEGDYNDANLLRALYQQMTNEIRQLQAALDCMERIYQGEQVIDASPAA